jgi:hypothetical protein
LRPVYCSQKVNGMPAGNVGKPRFLRVVKPKTVNLQL